MLEGKTKSLLSRSSENSIMHLPPTIRSEGKRKEYLLDKHSRERDSKIMPTSANYKVSSCFCGFRRDKYINQS